MREIINREAVVGGSNSGNDFVGIFKRFPDRGRVIPRLLSSCGIIEAKIMGKLEAFRGGLAFDSRSGEVGKFRSRDETEN